MTRPVQVLEHEQHSDAGIELYKVALSQYQELANALTVFLTLSEYERANRYRFLKDKNRFIICRTLLKVLLAKRVGLDIQDLQLDIDANKKPFLASHPSIYFNVTHSSDYALIAIAKSPIGVDVEYINKQFNYEDILPNVFNTMEIEELKQSNDSHLAFFQFWTRKEAIVKAIGKGIDDNLPKIHVTDGKHLVPTALMGGFERMAVISIPVNDDYIGALATTEDMLDDDNLAFLPLPTAQELLAFRY